MTASQKLCPDNFATVREFVRDELCKKNELERDAFHMTERVLLRQGAPCGFYFCIYGPRSVRLTAVWDLSSNAIYFYDSLGRRAASCFIPGSN
jgi:hypothetical protein